MTAAAGWAAFSGFQFREGVSIGPTVRRFAIASAWFAPAAAFAVLGPMWAAAAAGVFAAALAKWLRGFRATLNETDADGIEPELPRDMLLCPLSLEVSSSTRIGQVWVAAALQAGTLAALLGDALSAGLLAGLSSFAITWKAAAPGQRSATRGHSNAGLAANALLAIALTTFGMILGSARAGFGSGNLPLAEGTAEADNLISGAILLPPLKPGVLLAPQLPSARKGRAGLSNETPLSIPFSGEYWFFHRPLRAPPKDSLLKRESPLVYTFSTVDPRTQLVMMARQKLATPLDLECCGRIDLVMSNRDTERDTVAVELILIDSSLKEKTAQSLGTAVLPPARAILKFDVPTHPVVRHIDEIEVVFHLDKSRGQKSANVAIDRFDLVPKGL